MTLAAAEPREEEGRLGAALVLRPFHPRYRQAWLHPYT